MPNISARPNTAPTIIPMRMGSGIELVEALPVVSESDTNDVEASMALSTVPTTTTVGVDVIDIGVSSVASEDITVMAGENVVSVIVAEGKTISGGLEMLATGTCEATLC
jgi:hypothetical protein